MSTVEPTPAPATSAAHLVDLVCAVPGVRGIEAGVATTLRTLDARLRRRGAGDSRYGLVVDGATGTVTVEVALDGADAARTVVEDVQRTVQHALDRADTGTGRPARPWTVLVRVQSVAAGTGRG